MGSRISYQMFLAIAMNVNAGEADREEALQALVRLGDDACLQALIALYQLPATSNFKLVLLDVIARLTERLNSYVNKDLQSGGGNGAG